MIIVTETTQLGDAIAHKDVSYSRATEYDIDVNGNLLLYYYKEQDGVPFVRFAVATYAKGHFSKAVTG